MSKINHLIVKKVLALKAINPLKPIEKSIHKIDLLDILIVL